MNSAAEVKRIIAGEYELIEPKDQAYFESRVQQLEARCDLQEQLIEHLVSNLGVSAASALESTKLLEKINEQLPMEVSYSISMSRHLTKTKRTLQDLMKAANNVALLERVKKEEGCLSLKEEFGVFTFLQDIVCQHFNGLNVKGRVCLAMNDASIKLAAPKYEVKIVLEALINNALAYSQFNTEVKLSCAANESEVVFTVEDEGVGIPFEEHSKVFEPFYRGVNTNKRSGLGVGLSIAKAVVDKLGGKIDFESTEEVGSVFTVSLNR